MHKITKMYKPNHTLDIYAKIFEGTFTIWIEDMKEQNLSCDDVDKMCQESTYYSQAAKDMDMLLRREFRGAKSISQECTDWVNSPVLDALRNKHPNATALDVFCTHGFIEPIKYMRANHVYKFMSGFNNALVLACKHDQIEAVKTLVISNKACQLNDKTMTTIITENRIAILEWLFSHNCCFLTRDQYYYTIIAYEKGRTEIVNLFKANYPDMFTPHWEYMKEYRMSTLQFVLSSNSSVGYLRDYLKDYFHIDFWGAKMIDALNAELQGKFFLEFINPEMLAYMNSIGFSL